MFLNVNGARIHVEVFGSGKPILGLHGGPGLSDWRDTRAAMQFLEDEFTLVYLDFRGCGESPECDPATYTHEQWCADIEEVRRQMGLERVGIYGGSYGGFMALEYAWRHPDRVTHMVLRGAASDKRIHDHAIENALARGVKGVTRDMLEKLFNGRMSSNEEYEGIFRAIYPLYSTAYDPEKAKVALAAKKYTYRTHNAIFSKEFPKYDVRPRLKSIPAKALVVSGRHDWICPWQFAEEISRGMPNAILCIFERSGHAVPADCPSEFRALTRAFFKA
ncbi:MAG: alpha/beta hydrolase [Planctomycetes bacterium]|nr:alpha/beta hydrolase [Planctomycetota bacterium]